MTRKRLATRRALFGSAAPRFLPNPTNGPFTDLVAPAISSLPNITYNGGLHAQSTSRTNPLKVNHFYITGAGGTVWGGGHTLWVWCNTIRIDSGATISGNDPSISAGMNGSDGFIGCPCADGGPGGAGSSGGGGGSVSTDGTLQFGGGGGDGSAGNDGTAGGTGSGGAGGSGNGGADFAGAPVGFLALIPHGGQSGDSTVPTGPWGAGGVGASVQSNFCQPIAGGGGGAGGVPIILVCNQVINAGAFSCTSNAGNSGNTAGRCVAPFQGAAGGGGPNFLVFTKYWSGWPSGNFVLNGGSSEFCTPGGGAGSVRIYELNKAGSTILATHTVTTDSFNNL